MSYIAPKDYSKDPEILAKAMRIMQGELDLGWMEKIGERASARPSRSEVSPSMTSTAAIPRSASRR